MASGSRIFGIGIDVVDVGRFHESLIRTPQLPERIFTPYERGLSLASQAARFAAKEALAKALNAKAPFHWQEVEVGHESTGKPSFTFSGEMAERMAPFAVHITISHDAGIASAMVIVEIMEDQS